MRQGTVTLTPDEAMQGIYMAALKKAGLKGAFACSMEDGEDDSVIVTYEEEEDVESA